MIHDAEAPAAGYHPRTDYPPWAKIVTVVLLAAIMVAWGIRAISAAPNEPQRAELIAHPDGLEMLIADSPLVKRLQTAGVRSLLMNTPTVSGSIAGRELAVASGAEILRAFRMESILNIWMWEQIRDKPIRHDATYFFTNRLALHETLLEKLRERFGGENVRPYRDDLHEFGGDIPGNYIIEADIAPKEIRGISLDLDEGYRRWLEEYGFRAVFQLRSTEDVDAIGSGEAVYISDDAIAAYAFQTIEPSEVYLRAHVTNPGWPAARVIEAYDRLGSMDRRAAAVSFPPAHLASVQFTLAERGYKTDPEVETLSRRFDPTWMEKATTALVLLWFLFLSYPRTGEGFLSFGWKEREIRWSAILGLTVVALWADSLTATAWNLLVVVFTSLIGSRRHRMSVASEAALIFLAASAALLIGNRAAAGGAGTFVGAAAFAFYFAASPQIGRNVLLLAGLAFLSLPLEKTSPVLGGVLIGIASITPLLPGRDLGTGVFLLTLPAGLASLSLHGSGSPSLLVLLAAAATIHALTHRFPAGRQTRRSGPTST